jgi:hypothetical protein
VNERFGLNVSAETVLRALHGIGYSLANPQPAQFHPTFQQYGTPVTAQAPPTTVNPFYTPVPPAFQTGLTPQPLVFPHATGHYYLPAPTSQVPYMHVPRPHYQYLPPYGNALPPVYYLVNWQPTFPHPLSLPAYHETSPRPRRSPTPQAEIKDPSDYPELREWLNGVDRDGLRGRSGNNFSQFSAQLELQGFTSLLHLEQVTPNLLIEITDMEVVAAERLLRFAREDIGELRAKSE